MAIHQQTDLLRACLKFLDAELEPLPVRTLENGERKLTTKERPVDEKLVELTEVQILSKELEEILKDALVAEIE